MTYQRDKEKVKEYNKMRYETQREHILKLNKESRERNKEIIAERKKHPDVVAKRKEPIWCCECKIFIQKKNFARHRNSKTHKVIANLEINN
jgi:hypothetical protein